MLLETTSIYVYVLRCNLVKSILYDCVETDRSTVGPFD
jgi:hypothetical protein